MPTHTTVKVLRTKKAEILKAIRKKACVTFKEIIIRLIIDIPTEAEKARS